MNDKGPRKRPASHDFDDDNDSSSFTGDDSGRNENRSIDAPGFASAASVVANVERADSSGNGDADAENAKQSDTARENALAKERRRSQMRRKKSKEYHDRLQREVFSLSRHNTVLRKENEELERLIKAVKEVLLQNEMQAVHDLQQKQQTTGTVREPALTTLPASSTSIPNIASNLRAARTTNDPSAQNNIREASIVHDSQNSLIRQILLEELARRRSQLSQPGQVLVARRVPTETSFNTQNEVNIPNVRSSNRINVQSTNYSGLSILPNDTFREHASQANSGDQYHAALSQLFLSQNQSMRNAARSSSSTTRLDNREIISMLMRRGSGEGTRARLTEYGSAMPSSNLNAANPTRNDARFRQENEHVMRSDIGSLLQQRFQQRGNVIANMTRSNQNLLVDYVLNPNRQFTTLGSLENDAAIRAVLASLTANRSGQQRQFEHNRRIDEYARDLLRYRRMTLPSSQGGSGSNYFGSTLTERRNSAPPFPGVGGDSQANTGNVVLSGSIEEKCDESILTAQYIELMRTNSDQDRRLPQGPTEDNRKPSGGSSRAA